VDALLNRFRARIVANVEHDPHAIVALDTLRGAGWRVAIATNGDTLQQWAKIRRAGLDAHTDAVAVSEEVGAAKPDPRIFEIAARRCGADLADGGWMVGDSENADIAGGRGVGLRTIWMRRGRTWIAGTPPPDAVVDDIGETVPILIPQSPTLIAV
jgi:FMN phosphatase YigB (HAD superfamily)